MVIHSALYLQFSGLLINWAGGQLFTGLNPWKFIPAALFRRRNGSSAIPRSGLWVKKQRYCEKAKQKVIIGIIIYFPSFLMPPHSHTAAVQRIYEQHHSWLHGWLKGKLSNACDAADVAHDTFIRVLGAHNAAQIREPRDYLATVARGLVIDRYRRRAIEQAYLETLAVRPEITVISEEDKALIIETLMAVDKALAGLGARAHRIFMMSQVDGLTYQQIAIELKVSLTTVKKHMIRALTECSLIMAAM